MCFGDKGIPRVLLASSGCVCVCREDALNGSFRVDSEYVGMLVYSEEGV